ncbi:hypothetical protein [Streptomyces tsukubensis]|uniref:Uncharacterized protein n=1 Tax=Streptomyces tsukubensis TaxID=83656 RepID=A0A1V4A2D3_9ACTN|nr:hypothetical protein [Streptomyces tsukubensis]OON73831.1 hypothetical protein B1H18_26565 [Streptomyces tsukubensis]QFR91796.1 hypothetical protein GBW32_00455 [Streptomyces tsukubensis]
MDEAARSTSMALVEEAWRSGRAAPLVIADAGTDSPVGIINLRFRDDDLATIRGLSTLREVRREVVVRTGPGGLLPPGPARTFPLPGADLPPVYGCS